MLKCPLGHGVGKKKSATRQHSATFFGSKVTKKDRVLLKNQKRLLINRTTRRTTPELLGSQRWSPSMSFRMRGGTKCTVNSLASLLSMYQQEDIDGRNQIQDSEIHPSHKSHRHYQSHGGHHRGRRSGETGIRSRHRPSTSMGHSSTTGGVVEGEVDSEYEIPLNQGLFNTSKKYIAQRPNTSMGTQSVQQRGGGTASSGACPTPPVSLRSRKNLRSPNQSCTGRSARVLREQRRDSHDFDLMRSKKTLDYVMAHDLTNEREGLKYERESREQHHLLT